MQWEELNTDRYYKFINEIIKTRGQWTAVLVKDDATIFENHHIIPKCFGGLPVTHKLKLSI